MSGDLTNVEQARNSWHKATDALLELDRKAKSGRLTDHDALFELSHIVSFLVVAVGAMIADDVEKERTSG